MKDWRIWIALLIFLVWLPFGLTWEICCKIWNGEGGT